LITNYKAKSADALSMKFLMIWLLGDIANLSGEQTAAHVACRLPATN
jgi:hypothetical protein